MLGDGAAISAEASFRTLAGPEQKSINFVAWGDNRTNHPIHRQVADRVALANPDFVLNTGDLVEIGTRLADWNAFFDAERNLLANAPLYPSLGNHEGDGAMYTSVFALPNNERWYSFDSGPVHVVALDVITSAYTPGSAQYAWLEQDLQQTTRPWKIAYFHYPPYGFSTVHGSNLAVRSALSPLFERYGVQLVFNGHIHYYQRNVANGVTYVVTGGGGAPLYPLGTSQWTRYTEQTYHFVKVSVDGGTLTATGVRLDGTQFDAFTLAVPTPPVSPTPTTPPPSPTPTASLLAPTPTTAPPSPAPSTPPSPPTFAGRFSFLPFMSGTGAPAAIASQQTVGTVASLDSSVPPVAPPRRSPLEEANCLRCHQPFRLDNGVLLRYGWEYHIGTILPIGAPLFSFALGSVLVLARRGRRRVPRLPRFPVLHWLFGRRRATSDRAKDCH